MEELTFEEFQATERRARAKQQGTYPSNASKTSSSSKKQAPKPPSAEAEAALRRELAGASEATKGAPAASSVSVSLRERLGLFLELSEMQAAVCFLLVLDSFSALFAFSGLAEIYSGHVVIELWTRGLNSFSTFALVFFLLEVVSSFVAFGTDMVTHFGYLADIVIVAVQAYCEFNNLGRAYKLLNFFRFWRALRLFFSMVDAERAAHAAAREQMMDARREAEELRQQIKLLEDDIEKEKEARGAVEDMLQSYKEEVDTLNEALKIAAMDIAEVAEADDDLFSDEEGGAEDEEEGLEGDAATAASSSVVASTAASSTRDRMAEELRANPERNPSRNREELYRLATSDSSASKAGAPKPATFIVHPDGTFEYR